jgi:hypothetical protein
MTVFFLNSLIPNFMKICLAVLVPCVQIDRLTMNVVGVSQGLKYVYKGSLKSITSITNIVIVPVQRGEG